MLTQPLNIYKIRLTRSVYFLLNNRKSNVLHTRSTVLNNISHGDDLIQTVNVPTNDINFTIHGNIYVQEPVIVSGYDVSKSYLITHKSIFDLFDRLSIKKEFQYNPDEMERLIRVFCSFNSIEGLLWMHNNLIKYDKCEISYVDIAPSFLIALKVASTWHYQTLIKRIE